MSRITLRVRLELLSDTIWGSGYSIPGGEDIAVRQDDLGYPCLGGSTLKGLLRESLENLLTWTGEDPAAADRLLGAAGFAGIADGRRLHFTPLTLEDRPDDPRDCYLLRTFTSLEGGVVKEGTLRTASCIRAGYVFSGELACDETDLPLIRDALLGIKWAGTLRSRGFGRVRVTGEPCALQPSYYQAAETRCIRYRFRSHTPLLLTDLGRSRGNSFETYGYVPGSVMRGMVINTIAEKKPEWFASHKDALLSASTRFLDAVPLQGDLAPLPSIKGFYEDKGETKLVSVIRGEKPAPGDKRAKLGSFCALSGDTLWSWSADIQGSTRIQRKNGDGGENQMFQQRYLSAGQEFEGYILLDDPSLAPTLAGSIPSTFWLGADRYAGFGQCSLTLCQGEDEPRYLKAYGEKCPESILYLLALSPFTMLDETGEPCGFEADAALLQKLGCEKIEMLPARCSTSVSEYGGYNRTWESRTPTLRMYDRGSILCLDCGTPPSPEAIASLQREGIGIRQEEGFGQVLVLDHSLLAHITQKQEFPASAKAESVSAGAELRRKKYRWVMEKAEQLQSGPLSRSQLGTIQSICEQDIANGGRPTHVIDWLEKQCNDRGARHGARFRQISDLITQVLNVPLGQTLGISCEDSPKERLRLLCLLFNYSRKLPRTDEMEGK